MTAPGWHCGTRVRLRGYPTTPPKWRHPCPTSRRWAFVVIARASGSRVRRGHRQRPQRRVDLCDLPNVASCAGPSDRRPRMQDRAEGGRLDRAHVRRQLGHCAGFETLDHRLRSWAHRTQTSGDSTERGASRKRQSSTAALAGQSLRRGLPTNPASPSTWRASLHPLRERVAHALGASARRSQPVVIYGDPYGNRTRVSAVRGPRPDR